MMTVTFIVELLLEMFLRYGKVLIRMQFTFILNDLRYVVLTLFQNRNTNSGDKKFLIRCFWSYWRTILLLNIMCQQKDTEMLTQFAKKEKSNSYSTYSKYSKVRSVECSLRLCVKLIDTIC